MNGSIGRIRHQLTRIGGAKRGIQHKFDNVESITNRNEIWLDPPAQTKPKHFRYLAFKEKVRDSLLLQMAQRAQRITTYKAEFVGITLEPILLKKVFNHSCNLLFHKDFQQELGLRLLLGSRLTLNIDLIENCPLEFTTHNSLSLLGATWIVNFIIALIDSEWNKSISKSSCQILRKWCDDRLALYVTF